jgi:hypothetical protein
VLRHDVQPGKLVAGLALLGAAVAFGGDARGLWSVPWFVMVPIVVGGLCLAGATGTLTYAVRYRRRRPRTGAPGVHGTGPHEARIPGPAVHSHASGAQAGTDASEAGPRGSDT